MIQKSLLLPSIIYHPSSDGCKSQLNKYEIKETIIARCLKLHPWYHIITS
jgi:hypothetical protein